MVWFLFGPSAQSTRLVPKSADPLLTRSLNQHELGEPSSGRPVVTQLRPVVSHWTDGRDVPGGGHINKK